jgi:CRISPR-associated protein Csm4
LIEKDFYDKKTNKKLATELFFPKPLIHFKPNKYEANSKKEKLLEFLTNKDLKGIELLTLKQFNLFLNGRYDELYKDLLKDLEYPKFEKDLRVSVEIYRMKMSSKEGQLFSYYPKFLEENTKVVFIIKIFDIENYKHFQCEDVLKDVFQIGFGKKKSSGYGQFEVIGDIEGFSDFEEPEQANGFIILSNYIPSSDDKITEETHYDFVVKYGRFGEEKALSSNPFKKPIILFTPGSVFFTNNIEKNFFGRITSPGHISEFNLDAVQFGIPFILKFKTA